MQWGPACGPQAGDPEEGTGAGWGRLPSPARRAASRGGRQAPCRPAAARRGCSLARCSAEAGGSHPGQTPARCPRAARGDAEARGKQRKRLPGSLARGMETNVLRAQPCPQPAERLPWQKGPMESTQAARPSPAPAVQRMDPARAETFGPERQGQRGWYLWGQRVQEPGVGSLWSRGLCPGWALSVLLWTCPEIRDLTATLGTKGWLFKCCQSRQEMRMSAGEQQERRVFSR